MKRTITIDDTLQERVDDAIQEVKNRLIDYIQENELDELPDLKIIDYSGAVHEIIDSSVPVYYSEIDAIWYLYNDELVDAYNNAGIGDNPLENGKITAIYCYIEAKIYDWYQREAQNIFDDMVNVE